MAVLSGKRLLIVEGDPALARALAAEAERLGGRVSLCGSGDEALAALQVWPADGAVLGLPLAGGLPEGLAAALRRNAIPAVAAAGDGGGADAAEEARRLGARRYLAGPCRPEDLLAALVEVLDEPSPPAARRAPAGDPDLRDFDSLVFSQARPALDEAISTPSRRGDTEGLAGPLPEVAPRRPSPAEPPPILPAGPLAGAPLPRLLAVLGLGEATGALLLERGPARKLLFLEGGALAFATSNAPAERFGPRCVREGILDAAALTGLLRRLGPGETTAGALMARGLLSAERRARMVADQVAEIAWSTFEWREGTYRIALEPLHPRNRVPLALSPGEVILEGMRRVATLERLRAELPPELALARSASPLDPRLALRPAEADLLACADGTKGAGDLVALSGIPEREALALLQACRYLGLLVEVDRALATTRRIGFL